VIVYVSVDAAAVMLQFQGCSLFFFSELQVFPQKVAWDHWQHS